MKSKPFKDRSHAGRLLAEALVKYAGREDVMVLALPRGGVPVAAQVAAGLHAPLDVIIVRKLGAPDWRELAMGAIASGDVTVINDGVVRELRIPDEAVQARIAEEKEELHRRENAYRGSAAFPDVSGKTVILVDDGIATGSTMRAALTALRQLGPRRLVAAVPTAEASVMETLKPLANEVVVLHQPSNFIAVSHSYENFTQTTDEEVSQLLARAQHLGHPF